MSDDDRFQSLDDVRQSGDQTSRLHLTVDEMLVVDLAGQGLDLSLRYMSFLDPKSHDQVMLESVSGGRLVRNAIEMTVCLSVCTSAMLA